MKLLHLLAHLGIWPFDADVENFEAASGMPHDDANDVCRPIVLPEEFRPVVIEARWPTEYARRTIH